MNAIEIEEAVTALFEKPFDAETFAWEFLEAFGNKSTVIKRLQNSSSLSDIEGAVLLRNNIHLKVCAQGDVSKTFGELRESAATQKNKVKFVLATDGLTIDAENLAGDVPLACKYSDFPNQFGYFLSLAGIETVKQIRDSSFDIRATSRLNRLYVELLKDNPGWGTEENRHGMNHFMARLIFCFFAENTDIFRGNQLFTKTVDQMSDRDASNTNQVISEIFRALNSKTADRGGENLPRWVDSFPYVNGGLFAGNVDVPKFSKIARSYLLHIGTLDWTKINPDIFGSMIQAVADDEERGALGMHYTSVPNILKVLNPLFLDDLRLQLEGANNNARALLNLRKRISKIRIFDPACGSGNFLVIAYKQMREIENEINVRRGEVGRKSEVSIKNFRGIELKDFPAEIARLALIIAEYQCDLAYRGQKEALDDFLPLDSQNWITCGNALKLDWLNICPAIETEVRVIGNDLFESANFQPQIDFENEGGETYICGNPPFAGQKKKSDDQRADMDGVMPKFMKTYGELDYVTAFYLKAAEYISSYGGAAALVSTNSVVQGRHVPLLWPAVFKLGCKIFFAHRSFGWKNNATKNASVHCVVIGITTEANRKCYIFEGELKKEVSAISAYLTEGKTTFVEKSPHPISPDLQTMRSGNMPLDNGNLLLSPDEASDLIKKNSLAKKFIKKIVGAREINQGIERYCLWIDDVDLLDALKIEDIAIRVRNCEVFRKKSSAPKLAESGHAFRDRHRAERHSIILPNLSSEVRNYRLPILASSDVIASNLALAIYDGDIFQIALIASRMNHLWVEAVCGKLKQDFRYSNDQGWHTFPVPKLTDKQKNDLTASAEEILMAQERLFPKTLNDLYNDNGNNPVDVSIKAVHEKNDEIIERIYIGRRFKNDTERLEKLFELYAKMTGKK
jgi:hypothetical protein